jgi:hypothetical protein
VVVVVGRGTAAENAGEHGDTHGRDEDSAGDAQPRAHDVAGDAGGRGQQEAEGEHAAGVSERHDRADGKRVARPAAAAGNIRRHYRLAMPGQCGVCRAEHEREKHRKRADERCEVPADQCFELPVRLSDPAAHRVASADVNGRAGAMRISRLDV